MKKIKINAYLEKRDAFEYESYLSECQYIDTNISIHVSENTFDGCLFTQCDFKNCTFVNMECMDVIFEHCTFENVHFINCSFSRVHFFLVVLVVWRYQMVYYPMFYFDFAKVHIAILAVVILKIVNWIRVILVNLALSNAK